MGKYQAYPEYKDSGFQWLGEIPTAWQVIYSKAVFSERNEKAQLDDEQLTASQKYGILPQKLFMELEQQKVVQVLKGHEILKKVEVDDFVISMRSFQGGIEYSPYSGSISSAYVPLFSKKKVSTLFFKYFLKSAPYIQALQSTTNLVRDGQALRYGNFTQVPLPVFDFDEQENIGKFLDHETAKIDTLIEQQQQLIQLLKEKRQAVISHAVTKGLNPNVTMKDSGVEWLGEVPAHWAVKKLKHVILSLESGVSVNASDVPAQDFEYGVLKTSCVYTRSFRAEENKTVLLEEVQRLKCPVRKGAIIISRMNTPELVGASALVLEDAHNLFLPDRLWQTVFTKNSEHNSKYISYFMMIEGFRKQISLSAEGASSSMQNIAKEDYLSINIVLPNAIEQESIANYIDQKITKIDNLIEKQFRQIELMQERRTALISAAVTGKIDVRNWQAPNN